MDDSTFKEYCIVYKNIEDLILQISMIIQPTTDSQSFHHEAISTLLPNHKAKGHSNVKQLEKSFFCLEK